MLNSYENSLGNERTVELVFIQEQLEKLNNKSILNVGGIPSNVNQSLDYLSIANTYNLQYKICDFRGGDYHGDFNTIEFKEQFDVIIFLSSLEHFPQCSESDLVYRQDEDIRGFEKALSILKPDGIILLTVPFGKQLWQPYHQNYNIEGIATLSKGSTIVESYTYKLINNNWVLTPATQMEDVLYINKAFGVGCFKFKKD